MPRKPNETVQLKLRFSEALRRKLEKEADQNKRSMNAEIIDRLERSFGREEMRDLVRQTATTAVMDALEVVDTSGTLRPAIAKWRAKQQD